MKKISFFCLLLLIACNQNVVVNELNDDLVNNRWLHTDKKVFEFEIEQDRITSYNVCYTKLLRTEK